MRLNLIGFYSKKNKKILYSAYNFLEKTKCSMNNAYVNFSQVKLICGVENYTYNPCRIIAVIS